MRTIVDIDVTSVGDAISCALNLIENWTALEDDRVTPYVWFRGVNSCNHRLQPGAYWRKNYNEWQPLIDFSQRGGRFPDSDELGSVNTWGTYYLAQHYGIPTRLLDWTESFVSALFFATDGIKADSEACVWVMNPQAFNELTCNWRGIISPEINDKLEIWLPANVKSHRQEQCPRDPSCLYDNEKPLAIYPKHQNVRIRSQTGFFTVHGRQNVPIDELILKSGKVSDGLLARLCFRGVDSLRLQQQVAQLGIGRSLIYPDLDNFTKELQAFYKW